MKIYCITLLLGSLLYLSLVGYKNSSSTNYTLEVFKSGERIGQIETQSFQTGEALNYALHSDVEIDMLLTIKISETISNRYQHGKLLAASHNRVVNGVNQSKSDLRFENNQYVSGNGKPMNNTGSWIGISVLALYHKEPIGISAVYSEGQACWVNLKQLEVGVYKALLPDEKSATFYYTNGQLSKVVSETKWGEIVFKRK